MSVADLPEEVQRAYVALRELPDGRVAGVARLLFHWTLHYGITEIGIDGRYCYGTDIDAILDLALWEGVGDPPGRWHKHPPTGRRRDPDSGRIWDEGSMG
jgi:hypothetical protein